MIANLIIRLCLFFARKTPPRVITGRGNAEPCLTRYFLLGGPATEGMDRHAGDAPRWGLYLHHFHRGDDDGALHSHPWRWAYSLVLKGGYYEERRTGRRVKLRWVGPWTINKLTDSDFHRVDLAPGNDERDGGPGTWTLFLVGPLVQSWGFWDRGTGQYTPWKKVLRDRTVIEVWLCTRMPAL